MAKEFEDKSFVQCMAMVADELLEKVSLKGKVPNPFIDSVNEEPQEPASSSGLQKGTGPIEYEHGRAVGLNGSILEAQGYSNGKLVQNKQTEGPNNLI